MKRTNLILLLIIILSFSFIETNSFFKFLEFEEQILKNKNFNNNLGVPQKGYMYFNDDDEKFYFSIVEDVKKDYIASILYEPDFENNGWDKVTVKSYEGDSLKFDDFDKAYYMGYLEGRLTVKRILSHYKNLKIALFDKLEVPENVKDFFRKNSQFVKEHVDSLSSQDDYWLHVGLYYKQLQGLMNGYNEFAETKLNEVDFAILDASGDIEDIVNYGKTNKLPDFKKMTKDEFDFYLMKKNKCSSLIKLKEDFSGVFFGHDTWSNYSTMTRMYKKYTLKTKFNSENARSISFSSYPGAINSVDDFYILSSHFYVAETTNPIFEESLFDKMTPYAVLTASRTVVANRLAKDGEDWAKIFSKHNSGTYNNQFQILDLKKLNLAEQKIEDNALWIVEQIPGLIQSADLTKVLKYGYWPSYNSPFFKNIRNLSGYIKMEKEKPENIISYDYDRNFRANLFRREQGNVKDMASFKKVMRLNNYIKDNLSLNNPIFAIMARGDLYQRKPDDTYNEGCFGGIDSKLVSIVYDKEQKKEVVDFQIINGPSAENADTPTFKTNDACTKLPNQSFIDLPKEFNFKFIPMTIEF